MTIESQQGRDDMPPKRPMTPADLHRLRSVTDVVIHPGGEQAVVVIGWPDGTTDSNRANLYRVDLDGRHLHRLTDGHHDSQPRFSPDGSTVAFSRSEPGRPGKLVALDWPVGDTTVVAEFTDGGPGNLNWIDNHRLLVTAPQRPEAQKGLDDDELARRPRIIQDYSYRFDGAGYIHDRPNQIWLVDVTRPQADETDGKGDAIAVGKPGMNHGDIAVSPDGGAVVATASLSDGNGIRGTNHIVRYELDPSADQPSTCEPVTLTPDPGYWGTLVWRPDNRLVAFGLEDFNTIEFERMLEIDPSGPAQPTVLAFDDIQMSAGSSTARAVTDGMLVTGARRGRVAIDHYAMGNGSTQAGARTPVYEQDATVVAFDTADDGSTILAAISTTQRPAELWRLDRGDDPAAATRIVALNDEILAELDLATTETVQVTSGDGTMVEAFITRPPTSAPDTGPSRPGLVYVHGGPMFQYGHFFFDEFQMAAATGYVVIGGNPRGSDGYGQDWARDIIGNFGNRDWQDVQAITDHLAAQPDVDADRIGIGGGSYGGFMTSWALGHDDGGRYRAGLVERALTDFVSFTGTSDIGSFFTDLYLGVTVETDIDKVRRHSPLTYADRISAPTLIVHSEEDWRCPIEQAERLYTAIRRNGGEATLVRFPGENHELSRSGKPKHRVERFEIIHEFFAKHLGGTDFGTSHLAKS